MREAITLCTVVVFAAPIVSLVIGVFVSRFSKRTVIRLGACLAGIAALAGASLFLLLLANSTTGGEAEIDFSAPWLAMGRESPLVVNLSVHMDMVATAMATIASLVVSIVLPSVGRDKRHTDSGGPGMFSATASYSTGGESLNSQSSLEDVFDSIPANSKSPNVGDICLWRLWLVISLWAATVLLSVSGGFLQLFFFWQLQTVLSVFLVRQASPRTQNKHGTQTTLLTMLLGDIPFFVALCMLWENFESLDLAQVLTKLGSSDVSPTAIGGICVCLIAPILTRCAQFPFSLWVVQTSFVAGRVSAVLHAGLFMPAGVFLAIRFQPLFVAAPQSLTLLAIVGALSALLGAAIAATRSDSRRAISILTVCHLGFALIAVACGAVGMALVLLAVHALTKTVFLLVVDAVCDGDNTGPISECDGGRRREFPISAVAFAWCAVLLCGVFSVVGSVRTNVFENPQSDSFSSSMEAGPLDSQSQGTGNEVAAASRSSSANQEAAALRFWLTSAGLFLSAFSLLRVYFVAFFHDHPDGLHPTKYRESFELRLPLICATAAATAIVVVAVLNFGKIETSIVAPADARSGVTSFSIDAFGVNLLSSLLGIAVAATLYMRPNSWPQQIESIFAPFARLSRHSFYLHESVNWLVVRPLESMTRLLRMLDDFVIQGLFVNSFVTIPSWLSVAMRPLQVGGVAMCILSSGLAVAVLLIVSLYLMG